MTEPLDNLRYPIGQYNLPERYEPEMQNSWIEALEMLPGYLEHCIENLDAQQLATPYREGGWTVVQVVHHIADSHMNAYIRLKMTLTEENPVVKPYDEKLWANLYDVDVVPINISITLLHALHRKFAAILRNMSPEEWERNYYHPEHERYVPLWELVDTYAWHGRHHAEQIKKLRERLNW